MTKPFVFLHGGGQGSWVWDETIAALGELSDGAARCLALDVPGCGVKRGRDTSAISFDAIVQELLADMDAAGLTDIVMVGHSQAGTVLPRLAALRPGLFRRLVYVSCSSPLAGVTVGEMIGQGLHGASETQVGWPIDPASHAVAARYRLMFCNDMEPVAANHFLARLGEDMWPMSAYAETNWAYDHLAAIPASYLLCVRDNSLPAPWQERFAARFQAERITRLDAGHQVMNTQPRALAAALLAEAQLAHSPV